MLTNILLIYCPDVHLLKTTRDIRIYFPDLKNERHFVKRSTKSNLKSDSRHCDKNVPLSKTCK